MQHKVPHIPRLTSTDFDYAEYFAEASSNGLRKALNQPKYTVGATGTTYRVMAHWGQLGLLPSKNKLVGWRRFSLIERVWMEAVKKMRTYGVPLEIIADVCDQVMCQQKDISGYPDFEYFVIRAWKSKADPNIMILEDGMAGVGTAEEIELSKNGYGQSMLLISIKQILRELGVKVEEARKLLCLTENEIEFLTKLRLERNDEISVNVASSGKIKDIQTTQTTNEKPIMRDLLLEMEKEGGYGQISIAFEGGAPRSSRIIKKKRLK